jgi:multidrug efflux pump subunit AcrA (membrane-fusion protein)
MKLPLRNLTRRQVVIGGTIALALLSAGLVVRARSSSRAAWKDASTAEPLTATVISAPFLQEVIERGEVQSSRNIEVRCQVPTRGTQGVAIIQIVPEGTNVKTGDFLAKLDDSALQSDLNQQQIASNTSRALVVEAEADYEGAKLALNEYENGPFHQDELSLQSDQFVAQEDLRRAEEYFRYSQKLSARGYVTEVQLEADRFAVEKARKTLEVVATKLEVLRKYTKVKTMKQLKAALETTEARLRTRENTHNLDLEHLDQIKDYIAKCDIRAPSDGQVVYANDGPAAANGDPLIQEGKNVRERQVLVRLPDPTKMRVLARVNESRIDMVKKAMNTRITVDAFPDNILGGTVVSVGEYPLPSLIPYSTMKEYAAEVEIKEPPEALRSGMTAKVAIEVASIEQAIQVPLQAVMEREDRHFCLLLDGAGQLIAREVELGPANDATVVVKRGLSADEHVYLAPQNYESYVTFPPAEPATQSVAAN